MDKAVFSLKDQCRKNLARYTLEAFSLIPEMKHPLILDAGCGTGVPALVLIEKCNGTIHAVDTDAECLEWFAIKVNALSLNHRIRIIHGSVLDPVLSSGEYDVILAEGLLNVTGFEKGLQVLLSHSKKDGYLIIHDEWKNDPEKRNYFEKNQLGLVGTFQLGPEIWWKEYYACLEKHIKETGNDRWFVQEISEINAYKTNPSDFRSCYYILRNIRLN